MKRLYLIISTVVCLTLKAAAEPLDSIPSTKALDEVVVTGTFIPRQIKDIPVLTRVISSKDIEALNPSNIETLLQYELPGLQIGFNSMSQQPEIKYQGMDGEYVLFLINGERVSGEYADHNVDFSRFNIDDKMLFVNEPADPVEHDSYLLSHPDPKDAEVEELGVKSVSEYNEFLGKNGLLKKDAPAVVITGQMGEPAELIAALTNNKKLTTKN